MEFYILMVLRHRILWKAKSYSVSPTRRSKNLRFNIAQDSFTSNVILFTFDFFPVLFESCCTGHKSKDNWVFQISVFSFTTRGILYHASRIINFCSHRKNFGDLRTKKPHSIWKKSLACRLSWPRPDFCQFFRALTV